MARAIPPERFPQLVAAAAQVLVENGFKQTQMEAVASALGVAKGTIYRYVVSKHALVDAVIRYADGHTEWPDVTELPIATPAPGATAAYLSQRIASELADIELSRALRNESVDDPRTELTVVIRDLYRRVYRNRVGIKVADRCARDFPELAAIWFEQARFGQVTMLADLLRRRAHTGAINTALNPMIGARTTIETIMFWACNRHWDPAPQSVDESAVEDAVIALCVNALT